MYFTTILIILPAVVLTIPEEDKTFNLKIGFDLTNGENGMPALRIRDFEESAPSVTPVTKDTRKQTGENTAVTVKSKKDKSKKKDKKKGSLRTDGKEAKADDSSDNSKSSNSKSSEEEKPKVREGNAPAGGDKSKSSEKPEPKKEKEKIKVKDAKSSNSASKSKDSADDDSDAKALKHITKGMANPEEYEPEEKNPKVHGKDDEDDDTRRHKRFKRQAFKSLKKKNKGKYSAHPTVEMRKRKKYTLRWKKVATKNRRFLD